MHTITAITVTDQNAGREIIIDPWDFEERITAWFSGAPEGILCTITELAHKVTDPIWEPEVEELADFLGLEITR